MPRSAGAGGFEHGEAGPGRDRGVIAAKPGGDAVNGGAGVHFSFSDGFAPHQRRRGLPECARLNRLKKALPKDLAERIVNVKNFGYCFLEDRRVTKP